jgi:hypothetical protein
MSEMVEQKCMLESVIFLHNSSHSNKIVFNCIIYGPLFLDRKFQKKIKSNESLEIITRVEAGSNTSTMTLRVVGGDEKRSLKCETVKYGLKSQGTRTRERLRWQGQQHIQKTDPTPCQRGRPTRTRL